MADNDANHSILIVDPPRIQPSHCLVGPIGPLPKETPAGGSPAGRINRGQLVRIRSPASALPGAAAAPAQISNAKKVEGSPRFKCRGAYVGVVDHVGKRRFEANMHRLTNIETFGRYLRPRRIMRIFSSRIPTPQVPKRPASGRRQSEGAQVVVALRERFRGMEWPAQSGRAMAPPEARSIKLVFDDRRWAAWWG